MKTVAILFFVNLICAGSKNRGGSKFIPSGGRNVAVTYRGQPCVLRGGPDYWGGIFYPKG